MLRWRSVLLWLPLSLALWAGILWTFRHGYDLVSGRDLMCDAGRIQDTQTVYTDPSVIQAGVSPDDVRSAMAAWNAFFVRYYGKPAFVESQTSWWSSNVVLVADGTKTTWVEGPCNGSPGLAIVHLAIPDAAINRTWLVHELGHVLGFADHVPAGTDTTGYVNPDTCGVSWPEYVGVMSYCDQPVLTCIDGIESDCDMVARYWPPPPSN